MATVLEALKGINAYPIPFRALMSVATGRGLSLDDYMDAETINGKAYNLCKADVLLWLSYAPNVTQGGQSYSFTDEQRQKMRQEASAIYDEYEEEAIGLRNIYGYKGKRL